MVTIIIAGGSGTRLWPLSTSTRPKQFLEIDDSGRSLLQKTYDRVVNVSDKVYMVTSDPIVQGARDQLPEIQENIVSESSRRGVANALYLGFRRLINDGVSADEPIFVLWSDHLIHDEKTFSRMVAEAEVAVKNGANLVQFGIVPSYASNQLGYIKKGTAGKYGESVYEIDAWKYQPDQDTANDWFETGDYLWNAGYFVSTMSYVMEQIKSGSPESYAEYEAICAASDADLATTYNTQEGAILDHVLSEKMHSAHVVACTFDWVDVGNFADLHSVSMQDSSSNYQKGRVELADVSDSYVVNNLDIPVVVIGLDNIAVVATPDGILVVNKSQSKKVGDLAKKIQAQD
jgi:mannose-1-phosphate guanylyltransferase